MKPVRDESQRTPGKWTAIRESREDRWVLKSDCNGDFGHFCGWAADGVTTDAEDAANAALICHAVNCYEELLAACKHALALLEAILAKTK